MEGLSRLSNLRVLQLSCNKLVDLNGLSGLKKLEELYLDHNKIINLSGLNDIAGGELRVLDLTNNKIKDVKQIMFA